MSLGQQASHPPASQQVAAKSALTNGFQNSEAAKPQPHAEQVAAFKSGELTSGVHSTAKYKFSRPKHR